MGGNAHPSYSPVRLTSSQRDLVIIRLTAHFATKNYFAHFLSPAPAPGKTTHGDVDFLAVLSPAFDTHQLQEVYAEAGLFDKQQPHSYIYHLPSDSSSTSAESPTSTLLVQVDIETVPAAKLLLAFLMKSYGDVGMVLGAYATYLGFKLGQHKGLQYRMKLPLSGTEVAYDLCKDKMQYDAKIICDRFLGLEYARWRCGFECEEELFEWMRPVAWCLAKEDRNPKRKEREMFTRFVAWSRDQSAAEPAEMTGKAVLMREGLWDSIASRWQEDVKREQFHHDVKEVCNGRLVMEYLAKKHGMHVEGPELGKIMAKVKKRLPEGRVPRGQEVEGWIDEVVGEC